MSDQLIEISLDNSLGHSGRSGNSGRSGERSVKDPSPLQASDNININNQLNKSNISDQSKKEKLAQLKLNKQKYTFKNKVRCQSISNTLDFSSKLSEFDQWKRRIQFNQDITQSRTLIVQNELSPEFNKIKRIITLKKIRRPKSPTFIGSPVSNNNLSLLKKIQNVSLNKGASFEEKPLPALKATQSNVNYNSNQKEALRTEDSFDREELQKLNKSDIVHSNRDYKNEQEQDQSIFQNPKEMKTGQKFLMRQIYQQQIRALKSMNKVKTLLDKSKSPVHSITQIIPQELSSPKNENVQNLSKAPPRLMSSKRQNSNEQTLSDLLQQNTYLSPSLSNKTQQIYLRVNSKRLNSSSSNQVNNMNNNKIINCTNKSSNSNINESNTKASIVQLSNIKNSQQNSNQNQLNSQNQYYKQLISDPSVQFINNVSTNKQTNQGDANYLGNKSNSKTNPQNKNQSNNSQISQNQSQIKETSSQSFNNIISSQVMNTSQLSEQINISQNAIPKSINKTLQSNQNNRIPLQFNQLQLQINQNYEQLINEISPISKNNQRQLSPLSQILQPIDLQNSFIPYHKQPNLKKYLYQDDLDNNAVNYHTAQNSSINRKSISNQQKKHQSSFQQYQKQLSSIRKKVVYDQEFYEAEIKAIDISSKNEQQLQGKKNTLKTIEKALPFTNNLIKEKIKNLLDNGQFINPLPHFNKHQKQLSDKKAITPTAVGIGSAINHSIFDRRARAKRQEVNRIHHKSYIQPDMIEQPSFQSRSPSFVNHHRAISKQSQTNFIDQGSEDFYLESQFNQQDNEIQVQMSDDSKLAMMKDQLKKYIDQRSRTPLHQNFNKNKKLLYQNPQQLRLDTI